MKRNLKIPIVLEKVRIQGPKDFRQADLLLDTGARYTALSWEILKDVGHDPVKSRRKTPIVTANGVIEVPIISVKAVIMDELKVNNLEVVALDIPELAGIEGLLGLSFLIKMRTLIDYKTKILEMI